MDLVWELYDEEVLQTRERADEQEQQDSVIQSELAG